MGHTLSTVKWGEHACGLLHSVSELEFGRPALIHIRHTERPGVTGPNSNTLLSTPIGREASIEFGEELSRNRSYRIYHTLVDRSRETAEAICDGIRRNGAEVEIAGVFPFRTVYDPQAMDDYIDRVVKRCGDEDTAVAEMMNRWLAGLSPPDVFRPSIEFARMVAEYAILRLETGTSDTIDVYVTHDTWVGATLFHWFGIPIPLDGVGFLDGYLMQPLEEEMAVWFRGRAMRIEYPHWWG